MSTEKLSLIEKIREYGSLPYMSYSGRGSFGAKWPAFSCGSMAEFASEALNIFDDVEDDELRTTIENLQDLLASTKTDSLGRGMVIYWCIDLESGHPLYHSDDCDEEEDD